MLGILTMAGNTLRSLGSVHPVIKWGVVAIVGLLAVEFIGKEATSLYVAMLMQEVERIGAEDQRIHTTEVYSAMLMREVERIRAENQCIETTEEDWCAATDAFRQKWRTIDCSYVPDCGPDAAWRKQHADSEAKHRKWLKIAD
jgi:hypothetical protein